MKDKRRHKRFRVDVMEINGKMAFAKNVKILNLSIGGVLLQADRRLNIGSEYLLRIEGKGKVLAIKGLVVWSLISECSKDSRGNMIPFYKAGMKFTDITNDKKDETICFIKDHTVDADKQVDIDSPSGLRLYVRIRIDDQAKAILNFQESYTVKKLGQSGMLIEGDNALDLEDVLPMEMTLPENTIIMFWGRVVTCLLMTDQHPKLYEVGIEFIDISENDKKILSNFLRSLEGTDKILKE